MNTIDLDITFANISTGVSSGTHTGGEVSDDQ